MKNTNFKTYLFAGLFILGCSFSACEKPEMGEGGCGHKYKPAFARHHGEHHGEKEHHGCGCGNHDDKDSLQTVTTSTTAASTGTNTTGSVYAKKN